MLKLLDIASDTCCAWSVRILYAYTGVAILKIYVYKPTRTLVLKEFLLLLLKLFSIFWLHSRPHCMVLRARLATCPAPFPLSSWVAGPMGFSMSLMTGPQPGHRRWVRYLLTHSLGQNNASLQEGIHYRIKCPLICIFSCVPQESL